jgi:tRNA/tmRNA/rRNA uracil-C5-methylase (TrmA/RlmC/RlmD family)
LQDISLQREWKTAQVQQLFERVGKFNRDSIPRALPALGTEHIYHYRTKLTPHYDAPERSRSKEMEALGFQKKNSRQILDVTQCDIATHAINQKLQELREELFVAAKQKNLKKPNKGATLLLRDAWALDAEASPEHEWDHAKPVVETNSNVYVKTKVKDLVFRFLAGNFFQNNAFILPLMVDRVIDASIIPNPHGKRMTHLIDCYCGSGLFCLSAASKFDICVGIEVNDRYRPFSGYHLTFIFPIFTSRFFTSNRAIEEARVNAQLNHIENCKFIAASAEAIFDSTESMKLETSQDLTSRENIYVKDFPRETTTVVLDPPRKGCSVEFLEQLFVFGPQRIVYMSCDPSTQARDANSIAANGYEILSIEPIDLFPQTRQLSMTSDHIYFCIFSIIIQHPFFLLNL